MNYVWKHGPRSFYKLFLQTTTAADRFVTIMEIEGVVVVNLDTLYSRDCSIKALDQLVYVLHKIGHNKRIMFISEDGALVSKSGALALIDSVIKGLDLNEHTCSVVCRENININNATVVCFESIPYWIVGLLLNRDIPKFPTGPFPKKFACWFGRGTYYRLELIKYMYENHRDQSILSYQETGMIGESLLSEYFVDNIKWAIPHTPIIYDKKLTSNEKYLNMDRFFNKPYDQYLIEIVAETDLLSSDWITEKTVRNLIVGKPFLIMGGKGTLARIRQLGFKTFDPVIDESYDSIENNYLRIEAVKKEIDRLSQCDSLTLFDQLRDILEFNRSLASDIYKKETNKLRLARDA